MTRLIRLMRGSLVALALAAGGCQGELKMDGFQTVAPKDMSMSRIDLAPATLSFAQVNSDFDLPALGCSGALVPCHAPGNVNSFTLLPNADASQTNLMANYQQVLLQVNLAQPASSRLITRPLAGGPQFDMGAHGGGAVFSSTSNPSYQKWLLWIQLGAHFGSVSVSPSSDMASAPIDAAVSDAANGGG